MGGWFERVNLRLLPATERRWRLTEQLPVRYDVRGRLISDAHMAAAALEEDATLCSADRDCLRFTEGRYPNPVEAA